MHTRQGVRSKKHLLLEHPETTDAVPVEQQEEKITQELRSPPNKLHIREIHKRDFYTDDTGRFLVFSRSGKQYVMVAYHSSNVILVALFKTRKHQHRLTAYSSIMQRLKDRGLTIDLQILDNEASQN